VGKRSKWIRISVAAVMASALVMAGCSSGGGGKSSDNGVGPITFASGKDLTGAMPQLLAMWNKLHPDQKVTFIELSASPDDQRNSFVQDLQAKSDRYDVMWDDVVWTSEFAAHGWLAPLSKDAVGGSDVLPAAVATATYNGTMYGAPFMTNAQLLYYRSDLVPNPPTTWTQLEADCQWRVTASLNYADRSVLAMSPAHHSPGPAEANAAKEQPLVAFRATQPRDLDFVFGHH